MADRDYSGTITTKFIDSFEGKWRAMTNIEYSSMVNWITQTEPPARPVIADFEGDKWVILDQDYARIVSQEPEFDKVILDECSCVSGRLHDQEGYEYLIAGS